MSYDEREESVFLQESISLEGKRELRRQRRRKNQLIARIFMVVFLLLLLTGIVIGVSFLGKKINDSQEVTGTEGTELLLTEETEAGYIEQAEESLGETASEDAVGATEEESAAEESIEETIEQADESEALELAIETLISEMTLEEKVAGIFLVCPEDITGVNTAVQAGEGTKKALEEYPVGGIVYYGKNIKSQEQIKEMIANSVSYSKYPLFISVDEEGGEVARFANGLKLENPGHMNTIGKTKDPQKAKEAMTQIGSYLKEYGVNLNFAPVADILREEGKGFLKNRSFSTDTSVVSDMVVSALEGLKEQKVTGCVKHFPGIGEADEDTHDQMLVINRTKEELMAKELLPFMAAIEAGAEMIMVAHTSYPEIVGDNTPASLSKEIITEILRGELGYNGVVITDALNMAAVTEYYGADEAAIKALKAGSDMLFMPEDFELAYQGVLDAVIEGTISEERIEDGLRRIYRIKYKEPIEP